MNDYSDCNDLNEKSELNLDSYPLNIYEALEDSPMFRKSVIEAEEVLYFGFINGIHGLI